jgi:tripartite ATP-independent transporter DctP family solute receptor
MIRCLKNPPARSASQNRTPPQGLADASGCDIPQGLADASGCEAMQGLPDGRRGALVVLLIGCVALLAGCRPEDSAGPGPAPEHWRFAIEETIGSVQHAYALKFKELVEERSGGEIQVTVYPYGTLGTSDQLTEQLDMGIIQFVMASPGHLGKLIPEVQVFLLHFLFSDDDAVNNRVLNGDPELREAFDALYARKRMKLLSIFSEGWQVWTTKQPVRTPADFQGMKFRVMTSPLLLAAYGAYGASPTPLPYSEVYSALQLNMIDGQENPIFAIQEMSFYEVTDWLIFPRHAPFITTAVTNRDFFASLPPARQQLVREVVQDLNGYILAVQRDFNAHRLEMICEAKPTLQIIELSDDQREQFRQASLPVREQFVAMAGPDGQRLIEQIRAAIRMREKR